MPSAQVVNFGEDPYANAMGTFAKNFLGEINQKQGEKRNEDIFNKIKEKYGPNAHPSRIFKDVLEAEGLDQEYKRNKLNEIKEYASLSTKGSITPYQDAMLDIRKKELKLKQDKAEEDEEKPLTAFQKKNLKLQETRLQLERDRLKQSADTNSKKLPEQIDKYTSRILKDSEVKLSPNDKADLNSFVEQLMTEQDLGVSEAFNKAYEYIDTRRDKIDSFEVAERPSKWIGNPNPQEVEQAMEQAYMQLKQLYDEDGIDNQKDLRAIAQRAGWQPEEITLMLQKLFQRSGKQFRRGRPVKGSEVEGSEQGEAAQAEGLDDILFGE